MTTLSNQALVANPARGLLEMACGGDGEAGQLPTTAEALIIELLAQLDVEAHFRQAGLTARDVMPFARLVID
ncbi:MAG TPA: hypothetical protein VG294_10035 [Solirubrobacteraceae bacterium]|nr:hypothetical protein [Solirubrobacteraceae bacterium]